jgi:hypothetical protein
MKALPQDFSKRTYHWELFIYITQRRSRLSPPTQRHPKIKNKKTIGYYLS